MSDNETLDTACSQSTLATVLSESKMPFSCLFESCLKALKLASRYMKGSCHEAAMKKLAFRLNLAEDVVHSYPSMDAILTKEEQGERVYENLRAAIIGALVDVGLIEERLLRSLHKHCTNGDRHRLGKLRQEIGTLLEMTDVIKVASQRREPIQRVLTCDRDSIGSLRSALDRLFELLSDVRPLRRDELREAEFMGTDQQVAIRPAGITAH